MGYKIIKKMPTSEEIINTYPLSQDGYLSIEKHRAEIKEILNGKDSRTLLIIGPCSAWPSPAVVEYANRLKELETKVRDKIKIVMRVYIQKPRTIKGWTGPVNQPNPLEEPDIAKGALYCRKLMRDIAEMDLAMAGEALFTYNARGFIELLSWVAIGARSSENQEHRVLASSCDCPVGLKNPTHGSLKIAVNSVVAAQHSHYMVLDGYEVETNGNLYSHIVLRGSNGVPNYNIESIKEISHWYQLNQVANPAVIIDVSHDNCLINGSKHYHKQGEIILKILANLNEHQQYKPLVKGFMVESFLHAGRQDINLNMSYDGLSITDPCMGWEQTEELVLRLSRELS